MARHHGKDIHFDQVSNYTLDIDHPGILFGKIWLIVTIYHLYICCGTLYNLRHQDAYSRKEEQNPLVHASYVQPLMQLLASLDTNTTVDLARPHLRQIFRSEE